MRYLPLLTFALVGCAGLPTLPFGAEQRMMPKGTIVGGQLGDTKGQVVLPAGGLVSPPPAGEQMSFVSQKLASSEDERKVLTARVRQLEGQLRVRDQALAQASSEIQEVNTQIEKTRDDLQRWRQEVEGLRSKLRGAEHESKVTLEAVIHTLEQLMESENRPTASVAGH